MHDSFLAMILTNAKRVEARALTLTVDKLDVRIDMLLLDGSSQSLISPPPEILVKIIENLEQGKKQFQSSVYRATVETVDVKRGDCNMMAYISAWSIELA